MNGLVPGSRGAGTIGAGNLFDRVFDDFFNGSRLPSLFREGLPTQAWAPRVDISETEDALVFEAEVPGLTKDEIDVSIEDHVLTFSGEKKFEKNERKDNFHRIERSYGKFSRSFTLPSNTAADKAEATVKDGLLRVRVPKAEEAKARKIAVK